MTLPVAIYARLSGVAALTTLVGSSDPRIYPGQAPQNVAEPYVVYTRVDDPSDHTLDGPSGLSRGRVQIDCYDSDYDDADAVAQQVRLALDGFSGSAGGVAIQESRLDGFRDLFDPTPGLKRISLDFIIWHDDE